MEGSTLSRILDTFDSIAWYTNSNKENDVRLKTFSSKLLAAEINATGISLRV